MLNRYCNRMKRVLNRAYRFYKKQSNQIFSTEKKTAGYSIEYIIFRIVVIESTVSGVDTFANGKLFFCMVFIIILG